MGTDHNFAVMLFLLLFSHMVVLISATTLEVNDACEPAVACEDGEDCYLQPVDAGTRPCQPNPCHNGGVCETTESHFQGYLCHCTPGYVGVHCQHNVNECESDPCQNGGVCNDLEANYTCVCPGEYVGHNCQHKCSGPLGVEGGIISDAQFSASSIDSTMFGLYRWHPHLARLNRKGMVNAWSPADTDPEPWIQVKLRQHLRITGVITQGARRLGSSEFVKTFKVAYSQDGRTWNMMKVKGSNEDMVFNGNIDHSAPMANVLSPSFEAKYVRLYPKLCRGHCTLRMELLGCDLTGCTEPLGLKSGELTDSQMSASSVYRTLGMGMMSWGPEQARLDRRGKVNAWSAAVNDHSQWIQLDLLSPNNITAVITQGARDFGRVQFIRSFKLAYSSDGISWTVYQDESAHTDKVFQGNTDNDTHKKNRLEPNIYGSFLRLIPWSWSGRITLRMELLGCSEKQ